jgi:hypothetical protein
MSHSVVERKIGAVTLRVEGDEASCVNGDAKLFFANPKKKILNAEGEKLLGIALKCILEKSLSLKIDGDNIIFSCTNFLPSIYESNIRTWTINEIKRIVDVEIIFVGANKNNVEEPVPEFLTEVKEPEPDTSLLSKITRLDVKDAESQLMPRKTLSQWFRSLLVKRNPQPPPIINGEKNAYCGE